MIKLATTIITTAALAICLSQTGCVMECAHDEEGRPIHKHDHIVSDSAVTAAIKSKYLTDPNIDSLNIHVKTIDGVVTLTGKVHSTTMRDLAISLARETEGVKKVNSKLIIR
jgi:hyperosmotically inducible protein